MTTDMHTYVLDQMNAKVRDLALGYRAHDLHLDVADEGDGYAVRGQGIDADDFLRELIVENRETDAEGVTRYMLTIGGPTVWVENPTGKDAWAIYGNAAGLPEPVAMPLDGVVHHDAICALDLLLDHLTA